MEWRLAGLIPSRLPNFETKARQLRYRALGKACYDARIQSLLLGHHEDDQRETILLRLVEGYTGDGLHGISERANIPECQGLYGASQSGGHMASKMRVARWPVEDQINHSTLSGERREEGFEYGGVQVLRPLLHYKKRDLEATCKLYGIPWKTDATNRDPTLTTRNAIRYLIQKSLLPKALCNTDSMNYSLGNLATRARQNAIKSETKAEIAFQACKISLFDARSGRLLIRLPLFGVEVENERSSHNEPKRATEIEYIRARLLRNVLSIVSPQDSISLQTLEFATKAIFPDLNHLNHDLDFNARKDQPWSFTTCGVAIQRIDSRLTNPPVNPSSGTTLDPHFTWLFSRQLHSNNLSMPECTFPSSELFKQTRANNTDNPTLDHGSDNWQLYDGRYWIRIHNPTTEPLFVRPLTESSLHHLRTALKDQGQEPALRRLQADLAAAAPGKMRFTLPAIVDGRGDVLVLPTLGFAVEEAGRRGVKWQVRYKEVVLPKSVRGEAVIPPGVAVRDSRFPSGDSQPRATLEG